MLVSVTNASEWGNGYAKLAVVAANDGGNPAKHFGKQMRKERLARGWSLREFAARSGVDMATASLIENGKRPPNERVADACDRVFAERRGWFREYHDELQEWSEIPATFRNWSDYEDKSTTLRAWTPSIIDGLAQTEDYARAQIATERGIDAAAKENRVRERMARQRRILRRAHPPRLSLLVDEAALYRLVGSTVIMAAQLGHLLEVAAWPNVVLQVAPEVAHSSIASEYLIADDAVWAESVIAGGVHVTPEIMADVEGRFDTLRGECMKVSESLALIERQAEAWSTTGEKLPTRRAKAGRA